jgi:hypothetical protein
LNIRCPSNPDIYGRQASDFCIKRCHDFRSFEPDANLVNFASGLPIGRPGAVRYISEE